MDTALQNYVPGLEGVVAAKTRLSSVDGQAGELIIAGFPLEELALHASFEEVVFLLWEDRLPNAAELAEFKRSLAAQRGLPKATLELLHEAAKQKIHPMDALRLGVDSLSMRPRGRNGAHPGREDALALLAAFPSILAAYWRLSNSQDVLAPKENLGHAENFLYMLNGEIPSVAKARGLEIYLNTVVDHGLNASTFTARVIASTQSDLVSAIVGAIGALKGPLHGGAPGPALNMVFEIGSADKAEAFLRAKLAAGERLMGFGHRIYKVRDPRADVLAQAAKEMYIADGDMALYELARHVEVTAIRLLEEHKPGRNLQTNVEFYTALLLHGLGFSSELFSPTFAIARAAGWIAHCFEQYQDRILRPQSVYTGERDRAWVPVEHRAE